MADWNPALYTAYEEERTRPAAELLARVPIGDARLVVDLGCGPGNSTELLAQRWPMAQALGVDNSPAMLETARQRLPAATFEAGDIATWTPTMAPDLLYANASLQWVPDHTTLLPRLAAALAPRGALAIQMPDNLDQPSHALMRETAALPGYATAIGDAAAVRTRLLDAGAYYDLLCGVAEVDVWRTTYYHRMADPAAIVQWLKATGLRPFLAKLDEAAQTAFLADYEARIDRAYPARRDGSRLLAFPRVFIVARRRS